MQEDGHPDGQSDLMDMDLPAPVAVKNNATPTACEIPDPKDEIQHSPQEMPVPNIIKENSPPKAMQTSGSKPCPGPQGHATNPVDAAPLATRQRIRAPSTSAGVSHPGAPLGKGPAPKSTTRSRMASMSKPDASMPGAITDIPVSSSGATAGAPPKAASVPKHRQIAEAPGPAPAQQTAQQLRMSCSVGAANPPQGQPAATVADALPSYRHAGAAAKESSSNQDVATGGAPDSSQHCNGGADQSVKTPADKSGAVLPVSTSARPRRQSARQQMKAPLPRQLPDNGPQVHPGLVQPVDARPSHNDNGQGVAMRDHQAASARVTASIPVATAAHQSAGTLGKPTPVQEILARQVRMHSNPEYAPDPNASAKAASNSSEAKMSPPAAAVTASPAVTLRRSARKRAVPMPGQQPPESIAQLASNHLKPNIDGSGPVIGDGAPPHDRPHSASPAAILMPGYQIHENTSQLHTDDAMPNSIAPPTVTEDGAPPDGGPPSAYPLAVPMPGNQIHEHGTEPHSDHAVPNGTVLQAAIEGPPQQSGQPVAPPASAGTCRRSARRRATHFTPHQGLADDIEMNPAPELASGVAAPAEATVDSTDLHQESITPVHDTAAAAAAAGNPNVTCRRSTRKRTAPSALQAGRPMPDQAGPAPKRRRGQASGAAALHRPDAELASDSQSLPEQHTSGSASKDNMTGVINRNSQDPHGCGALQQDECKADGQANLERLSHQSAEPNTSAADASAAAAAPIQQPEAADPMEVTAAAAVSSAQPDGADFAEQGSHQDAQGVGASTDGASEGMSSRRSARVQQMGCLAVSSGQASIFFVLSTL